MAAAAVRYQGDHQEDHDKEGQPAGQHRRSPGPSAGRLGAPGGHPVHEDRRWHLEHGDRPLDVAQLGPARPHDQQRGRALACHEGRAPRALERRQVDDEGLEEPAEVVEAGRPRRPGRGAPPARHEGHRHAAQPGRRRSSAARARPPPHCGARRPPLDPRAARAHRPARAAPGRAPRGGCAGRRSSAPTGRVRARRCSAPHHGGNWSRRCCGQRVRPVRPAPQRTTRGLRGDRVAPHRAARRRHIRAYSGARVLRVSRSVGTPICWAPLPVGVARRRPASPAGARCAIAGSRRVPIRLAQRGQLLDAAHDGQAELVLDVLGVARRGVVGHQPRQQEHADHEAREQTSDSGVGDLPLVTLEARRRPVGR